MVVGPGACVDIVHGAGVLGRYMWGGKAVVGTSGSGFRAGAVGLSFGFRASSERATTRQQSPVRQQSKRTLSLGAPALD